MRGHVAGGASLAAVAAAGVLAWLPAGATTAAVSLPRVVPAVSDYQQMTASETPPTQAQCASAGRRCFNPQSTRSAYDLAPLYNQGYDGHGRTIAIVDSYGSDTMAHDLHVYDQQFGLPPMCGEEGVACQKGMPTFKTLTLNGSPATKAPPSKSQGTGQEDKSAWALEAALDVETSHAIAPGANILLVTTNNAETLGVQGLPQMMKAEKYVVDNHLADVISQSFGTAEEAFQNSNSLENLRDAFKAAYANHVTVLASSGDGGSANAAKAPVAKGGKTYPYPTVSWPASDPLVTGVGGTYLCTDPNATQDQPRTVDSAPPPVTCQNNPGVDEIAWIDSGGGFSHVFARPTYQDTTPPGSTPIPDTQRGVPDIGLQASSRTGALVYVTLPPSGDSGLMCGNSPCSAGWYDIGGTSLSCPQWAGMAAIADQIAGHDLGLINPALYRLASDPATYGSAYHDVTVGNNQADPDVPGYPATTGWDPVTGLGTPDAARLLPALAAAG